jgi:mono/diheme cytochrome c family protein
MRSFSATSWRRDICRKKAAVAWPLAARAPEFRAEQIKQGADLFARNCATCHGGRMRNPQWAADLRTFPRDGHARFVDAVANGKRNMPAWDDVLNPEQMEALWAYVIAGEAGN